MRIGAKIQQIREQNGISQEKFASDLAISRQAVSKWENGKAIPDIENLMYISNLYDISLDELIKGDPTVGQKVIADSRSKKWYKMHFGFFALLLIYIAWFGSKHDIWQVGLAIAAIGMMTTDTWLLRRIKTLKLKKR